MDFVAIKMLMGDTAKYIGIILGVMFASVIMTQQPSIFVGLMTRTFGFIADTNYPDLWITDPEVKYIDDINPMQDTKLLRVRGIEGVKWAVPLYKGNIRVKTSDGNFQGATMVGVDTATLIGAPPIMLAGQISDLRKSDSIIINKEGTERLASIGPDGKKIPVKVGDVMEINDLRAVVVGIAKTARSFQSRPTIYTTYARAVSYSPGERLKLSFILAGVKPGVDVKEVEERIRKNVGLAVFTPKEFEDITLDYFLKNTGIPINFGTSVLMGFLVGAAVAGQMFYNFTHDNMKQFGALKAMGTSNRVLIRMILLQASIAGFTGWGIGAGLATLFGITLTGGVLAFKMIWQVPALSAVGVILIMMIASLISLIKVIKLEPAVVFK